MNTLIAVWHNTVRKVRTQIVGCEDCTEDAEIPLSWVLDAVTGRDGSETDYVLAEPLKCAQCFALTQSQKTR